MSERTPDTEEVAYYYEGPDLDAGDRRAAFDRWLAETIREAKAEAWDEGWHAGAGWPQDDRNPYMEETNDD